uniref:Uncharacterized protein n=1 Tax=Megaselia scalaris TaxID=36166 RepID=T1GIR5_MEGSC
MGMIKRGVIDKWENYVVRWHSFQQNNPLLQSPNYLYDRISSLEKRKQIFTLSCGEFQMIKKLALVTLTGFMEKYCSILKSECNIKNSF